MATPQITTVLVPPLRSEGEAAFTPKAEAFVTDLPTAITEINTVVVACNDYAVLAAALSNYAGVWSTLTGALSAGASVYHSSVFWVALVDIADVTTSTPVEGATWAEVATRLASTITNGDTTHAVTGDAIFDALALKAPLASPTFTTPNIGVASGTSLTTGSTAYASRSITSATGGVLDVALGSAAGDDFTVDTSKLVVEGDTGKVGIGTASPSNVLHVRNSNPVIRLEDSDGAATIYGQLILDTTGGLFLSADPGNVADSTSIGFSVDGTSKMTISSAGLVNVVGEITAGTKTFKIDHPADPDNKILYHMAIEGPRIDLIYRGTAKLVDGKATIDLNKDSSVPGMTDGTFEALTQNAEVTSVNAKDSFDRVKAGVITGATFEITSENAESVDEVNWVVMAERADPFVKAMTKTDVDGHLITEEDKEAPDLTKLEDKIIETDKIEEDLKETTEKVVMDGVGYKIHYKAYGETMPKRRIIKHYIEPIVDEPEEIIKK